MCSSDLMGLETETYHGQRLNHTGDSNVKFLIDMSQQEITMALSVWGAVTGTIGTVAGLLGLWLRFRQHGLDKAELRCESEFRFESPTRSQHKIAIRSTGRRPVTVDAIRYLVVPRNTWHRLIKRLLHRSNRYVWVQELRNKTKIAEGEKTEVNIELPDSGLEVQDIYKAEVIDQTGKHWYVKWPSLSNLSRIATSERIDLFECKNEFRVCSVTGYRLGEKYYLETKFNTIPGRTGVACGRDFWLTDVRAYSEKYKEITENQCVQFLASSVNEIT